MPREIRVKVKKKVQPSTTEAVKQLTTAVAFAEDGAPESAMRCANAAVKILANVSKARKKLIGKVTGQGRSR